VTAAGYALLALVVGLFLFDLATLGRRARRLLVVEGLLFALGGFFIASPDSATWLAHRVGIGRGVDFVLYPVVIWLVRESLVNRHHRWAERERLSELVRTVAIERAVSLEPGGPSVDGHSASDSASRTT
jgi:hypothetical protein